MEILWILSEKFCFIFFPGPDCPDPEWFFSDPTPDLDPKFRIRPDPDPQHGNINTPIRRYLKKEGYGRYK
jgi:hypothetical protein